MKVLEDGRICCRVKITGSFRGQEFEYIDGENDLSQFIWPPDEHGNIDPSDFWWRHGNMACDCNRAQFLPNEMAAKLKQSEVDDGVQCGHEIKIDSIVPIERGPNGEELKSLFLNESSDEPVVVGK